MIRNGMRIGALTTKARRARFRKLHESGFFVIPNPWDIGGVRKLEKLGFKAIASTSAGYAASLGQADQTLSMDVVLEHLRVLSASTELPVNADFEAGFADAPEEVGANVRKAVETGIAGFSIEDRSGDALYELPLAVERIRAARAAIDEIDPNIILVGRSEGFLIGNTDIKATIGRLAAYAEAGADCLYAPGVVKDRDIKAIVDAVAPKAVNVLLVNPEMNASDLERLGVRRVSVGSLLAKAAAAGFDAAATMLARNGSLPAQTFR